jgi:hypothetical protein
VVKYRYSGFGDYFDIVWKEREAELIAPIKTITAPRDFVVTLPDRRCATDLDVGASNCVFELPANETSVTSL